MNGEVQNVGRGNEESVPFDTSRYITGRPLFMGYLHFDSPMNVLLSIRSRYGCGPELVGYHTGSTPLTHFAHTSNIFVSGSGPELVDYHPNNDWGRFDSYVSWRSILPTLFVFATIVFGGYWRLLIWGSVENKASFGGSQPAHSVEVVVI